MTSLFVYVCLAWVCWCALVCVCVCVYVFTTLARSTPLPIAVLIFCTHWVRLKPINHVCECLISTLFVRVSFSWLSARFIMAFGEMRVVFVCVCVCV